jgi:MoaA/NifB/PqqE/SkfB family radical SAM enzyme
MRYLSPDDVDEIHLEISTLCNAACPMCARNKNGAGTVDNLKVSQWKQSDIERVFTPELTNLKTVQFCGTHGDPITAQYLIETISFVKSKNLRIEIHTNGSLKPLSWWKNLTTLLDEQDIITFGIDGIDTNHLYRQNTDINKILERLKICCNSRSQVAWDYLVFKHNEHELQAAKQLAKELGVDKFRIRKTARFDSTEKFPVKNNAGDIIRYLEPPVNVELRHPELDKISKLHVQLKNNADAVQHNIQCLYKKKQKIYVNSRLEVFPCCYISDENEYGRLNKNINTIQTPIEELNLRNFTWTEILNNSYYQHDLVDSFTNNSAHKRCIKTCGVVDRESGQSESVQL